ncbi:MAG TPA: hypothetical protein VGM78_06585, partial [Ilumatobacteraceae bacterium]
RRVRSTDRSLRAVCTAALLTLVPFLTLTSPAAVHADGISDFCAGVSPGVTVGRITDPALVELSGLAASRAYQGVLWAHNDSGDTPRLFALSDAGASLGTYTVPGATAIDWEDIAAGPGPDPAQHYLYIGDIGENGGLRQPVTVYRVAEPATRPDGSGGAFTDVHPIHLGYPAGGEDAEALIVDPLTGDLTIITKELSGTSKILTATAVSLDSDQPITMTQAGTLQITDSGADDPTQKLILPSTMVTAADISPDGHVILVRTYQQVLAFQRADGQSVADALLGTPCEAPQVGEPQGEAIAFSDSGDAYYTSGEIQLAATVGETTGPDGFPLSRFAIAAPQPATTTTTAASTTVASAATTTPATPPATPPSTTTPVATTPATTPTASTPAAVATHHSSSSSTGWILLVMIAAVLAVTIVIVVRIRPDARKSAS